MFTDLYYTLIFLLDSCKNIPHSSRNSHQMSPASCTLLMDFLYFCSLTDFLSRSSVKSYQPMHSHPWYRQHIIGWLRHSKTLFTWQIRLNRIQSLLYRGRNIICLGNIIRIQYTDSNLVKGYTLCIFNMDMDTNKYLSKMIIHTDMQEKTTVHLHKACKLWT